MTKLKLALHLVAQLLAQGAIIELVPTEYKIYFAALVAVVGVLVAFFDQSYAIGKMGKKK